MTKPPEFGSVPYFPRSVLKQSTDYPRKLHRNSSNPYLNPNLDTASKSKHAVFETPMSTEIGVINPPSLLFKSWGSNLWINKQLI